MLCLRHMCGAANIPNSYGDRSFPAANPHLWMICPSLCNATTATNSESDNWKRSYLVTENGALRLSCYVASKTLLLFYTYLLYFSSLVIIFWRF